MSKQNQTTIDQFGRIVIPKAIRSRLGLSPGATLVVEERDDREILLRLPIQESQLADKGGVLVVQSRAVGEIEEAERQERKKRITDLVQKTGL